MWCNLDLPDDADMDAVIKIAKEKKGYTDEAEEIVTSLGFNMNWSVDHETEVSMSTDDNDGCSTVQVWNGSELIYENDEQ